LNNNKITWIDVLKNNGFNSEIAESLIGFISWKDNNIYSNLGEEISDVLNGYKGEFYTKDVNNNKYDSFGILFLKKNFPDNLANNIYDSILDYENNQVYNDY